ncbi:NDUFA12-domain-containing protein [Coemansia reversa NRRL 1564]|uniref:NADH dehydrogenase [ubiquinone] 1 alpha subcomplex subunit n=1 Tax=Coemansia reversa (strain ATCC 12441 / NRRL 1564) TaxID=763665 RepID=A0A2G5BBF0_COERN|nr:NDUFA12-domain-containing protein [Coemansia reversa NRRL 1564]|eukprot:PIA16330.1 NDUFA12-domain-containing protein [Coemansia reversa NRRL 1564]
MSLVRFLKFSLRQSPLKNFEIYRKLDDAKWGRLVGVDELGNRYYENPEERYGRERWCLPAARPSKMDASQIPPRWHSWLHKTTDEVPKPTPAEDAAALHRPKWMAFPHYENFTGTKKANVTFNTVRPKVEPWAPNTVTRD